MTTTPTGRVTGPDFVALMVDDLERSARFYTEALGLERTDEGPPHAVVFAATPCAFAVRTPVPGLVDLADDRPGAGVALWFATDDAAATAARIEAEGGEIVTAIEPGPFGRTFAFVDPDGYRHTVHDG